MNANGWAAWPARIRTAAALGLLALPGAAMACTLCDSAQAVSIRQRLFDGELWRNGAAVLLPIALLLLIVAAVGRDPAAAGRR